MNNLVRCDKGTYDQLYKEVPTYNLITPSIVSWLKVRGSLARRALTELMGKGLIKQVVGYSSQMIYTRMIGDKEAESSSVIEKCPSLAPGSLARTFPRKNATPSLRSRLSPRPSRSASPA